MKIGIISVNDKPTNILSRGGTEVFSANLARQLSLLGHEVYLFGSKDSYVKGVKTIATTDESLQEILEKENKIPLEDIKTIFHVRNLLIASKYQKEIDVFHDNMSSVLTLSLLDLFYKPVISTLHMPIETIYRSERIKKYLFSSHVKYVVASAYQKKWLSTESTLIYNGIDIELFQKHDIFSCDENMIWIGRVDPNAPKGLDDALIVASRTGKKLIYVSLIEDEKYYKEKIEPLLCENAVNHPHFQTIDEKINYYCSGKILLNPIKWEEPFGLTFIEAMATGTPVVAYAKGAAPELIKDGETGFLINSSPADVRGNWIIKKFGIEGLCEAVERIYSMQPEEYREMRAACAKHISEKYSLMKMAQTYEALYLQIVEKYQRMNREKI